MTYILEEERKHLSDLLVIAQQRLNTLKEIVATTQQRHLVSARLLPTRLLLAHNLPH